MILDAEEKVGVTPSLLPVAGRFLGGALMGLIVPCPSKRKKNIFFVCNFLGKVAFVSFAGDNEVIFNF